MTNFPLEALLLLVLPHQVSWGGKGNLPYYSWCKATHSSLSRIHDCMSSPFDFSVAPFLIKKKKLFLLIVDTSRTCKYIGAAPRNCKGKAGKTFNNFLPSISKDSHVLHLCTVCRVQVCNIYVRCDCCKDSFVDEWSVVRAHIDKLQEECEEKKAALCKSSSSFQVLILMVGQCQFQNFDHLVKLRVNREHHLPWIIRV